jgi:hypothetical protein
VLASWKVSAPLGCRSAQVAREAIQCVADFRTRLPQGATIASEPFDVRSNYFLVRSRTPGRHARTRALVERGKGACPRSSGRRWNDAARIGSAPVNWLASPLFISNEHLARLACGTAVAIASSTMGAV